MQCFVIVKFGAYATYVRFRQCINMVTSPTAFPIVGLADAKSVICQWLVMNLEKRLGHILYWQLNHN